MKNAIFLTLAAFFFIGGLRAAEKEDKLDFSQAFPKEKVFSTTVMADMGFETYAYLTNDELEKWEKALLKFLGKEWRKKEMSKGITGQLEIEDEEGGNVPAIPIKIEKIVEFTREDSSGPLVMLSQNKMEIGETKYMISLMVMSGEGAEAVGESREEKRSGERNQEAPTGGISKPEQ